MIIQRKWSLQSRKKEDEIVIELKVAASGRRKGYRKAGPDRESNRSVVKAASSKTEKKVVVEIQ